MTAGRAQSAEAFRRQRIRAELRVTITHLADRLDVLPSRLSRWEHGIHQPPEELAARWDEILRNLTQEKRDRTRRIHLVLARDSSPYVRARIRLELGVNVRDMARRLEICPSTLWRWEGGRMVPRPEASKRWIEELEWVALEVLQAACRRGGE